MTGVTYETAADRSNEERVAALFGRACGWQLKRMPRFNPIDRYAERDGYVVAWVEVKCRNHMFGTYDTALLPARKYLSLMTACVLTGDVPGLYVVGYRSASGGLDVRWVDVRELDVRDCEVMGARLGAGASVDRVTREPVVHIPVGLFNGIGS